MVYFKKRKSLKHVHCVSLSSVLYYGSQREWEPLQPWQNFKDLLALFETVAIMFQTACVSFFFLVAFENTLFDADYRIDGSYQGSLWKKFIKLTILNLGSTIESWREYFEVVVPKMGRRRILERIQDAEFKKNSKTYVEICHAGMLEDTNSLDGAQFIPAVNFRHFT